MATARIGYATDVVPGSEDYLDVEFEEGSNRYFNPAWSPMHRGVPEAQLITYDSQRQVSQLQIAHPYTGAVELDQGTLVVWIDGACRDNGRANARASWGVYFGPGSCWNASGRLDPRLSQTSSRAEIEALSQALDQVKNITAEDYTITQVRIITDSEYLVKTMCQWIDRWIADGGVGSRGRPVAHFDKLTELNENLDDMVYGDDGGLDIRFWQVGREKNRDADRLANEALD